MAQHPGRKLALTTRWKVHLAIFLVVLVASVLWIAVEDGTRLALLIPLVWGLMLAATAIGDYYFDRRQGWEDKTGIGWTGNMNPLSRDD